MDHLYKLEYLNIKRYLLCFNDEINTIQWIIFINLKGFNFSIFFYSQNPNLNRHNSRFKGILNEILDDLKIKTIHNNTLYII